MQLGKWNKDIGDIINNTLKKSESIKLKAVLLTFFFKKMDISL